MLGSFYARVNAVALFVGATAFGLILVPTNAAETFRDNECVRMFESVRRANPILPAPQALPPGFNANAAKDACTRATRSFPDEWMFFALLADAYWIAGERETAVSVLARSVTRFGRIGILGLGQNTEALALLKKLAETDADAQVALAHLYMEGDGVSKDTGLANSLFRQAADQGNPEGEYQVGHALWWAATIDPDNANASAWTIEAETWLRKAAAQCHPGAQETIDAFYDMVGWDQSARNRTLVDARRGDLWAQGRLGREYMAGIFGPQSDSDAYAWISIALERGSEEAEALEKLRYVLTERMTQAQMADAQALAVFLKRSLCVD